MRTMSHSIPLRRLAATTALIASAALLGCTSHTHFTPRAVDARLDETMNLRGGRVAIVPGEFGTGTNRIGMMGINTVTLDYAEYTTELARVLGKAFEEAGATVSSDAAKSLSVSVIHVNFALGGLSGLSDRYDCFVEIRADTSDGLTKGFVGVAGSSNFGRGCNHAIAKGAREVLLDPEIRSFVESGT